MELRLYSIIFQYSTLLKITKPISLIKRTSVVLSYKVLGESMSEQDEPPIFIFHGLLGSKKHWEGIGKTMLNLTKRNVVAVDLRNHGDSPHTNSHRYEELATDILTLFEKLGVKQATLVGHSMGGKAAMCLALMAPVKITGVLVIDTSPTAKSQEYSANFPKILQAMKAVDFSKVKNLTDAQKLVRSQLKDVVSDDYLTSLILTNISIKSDHIGWILNIDVLIKYMKHIASFPKSMKGKQYYGPTLFIGGQLSEFVPPDDLPYIRTLFPKAVITYIPKTGHNLHVDDPRSFMEIAISFIKTHHYKRPFKSLQK